MISFIKKLFGIQPAQAPAEVTSKWPFPVGSAPDSKVEVSTAPAVVADTSTVVEEAPKKKAAKRAAKPKLKVESSTGEKKPRKRKPKAETKQ